jgi:hypothetical protein
VLGAGAGASDELNNGLAQMTDSVNFFEPTFTGAAGSRDAARGISSAARPCAKEKHKSIAAPIAETLPDWRYFLSN